MRGNGSVERDNVSDCIVLGSSCARVSSYSFGRPTGIASAPQNIRNIYLESEERRRCTERNVTEDAIGAMIIHRDERLSDKHLRSRRLRNFHRARARYSQS